MLFIYSLLVSISSLNLEHFSKGLQEKNQGKLLQKSLIGWVRTIFVLLRFMNMIVMVIV